VTLALGDLRRINWRPFTKVGQCFGKMIEVEQHVRLVTCTVFITP
jgi:hypothetical protein